MIKDTNKNLNSVIITSIKNSKTPGAIRITTNGNRKGNLSNEGRVKTK